MTALKKPTGARAIIKHTPAKEVSSAPLRLATRPRDATCFLASYPNEKHAKKQAAMNNRLEKAHRRSRNNRAHACKRNIECDPATRNAPPRSNLFLGVLHERERRQEASCNEQPPRKNARALARKRTGRDVTTPTPLCHPVRALWLRLQRACRYRCE